MIRYFCDRCKKECKSDVMSMPIYARDGMGAVLKYVGVKHLCEECAKKFHMIKDRLKHEEDFFNMTDKEFSLMEYDFKVGDKVITSKGQVGVIEAICDCERCEYREFYELTVKTISGVGDIYITNIDKEDGFKNFYRIGKYKFGNINKERVEECIESLTHDIDESHKRLKEYYQQLKYIESLTTTDELTKEKT